MVSTVKVAFFITTLPTGSTPSHNRQHVKNVSLQYEAHSFSVDTSKGASAACGDARACRHTWAIGTRLLGVEFGSQRCSRLELGFGEL